MSRVSHAKFQDSPVFRSKWRVLMPHPPSLIHAYALSHRPLFRTDKKKNKETRLEESTSRLVTIESETRGREEDSHIFAEKQGTEISVEIVNIRAIDPRVIEYYHFYRDKARNRISYVSLAQVAISRAFYHRVLRRQAKGRYQGARYTRLPVLSCTDSGGIVYGRLFFR